MQRSRLLLVSFLAALPWATLKADSNLREFISAQGDQLMQGSRPFHFLSFNVPNLQLIEDNVPFTETNPWRLPDRFEIEDALKSVHQMGGTVVRTYVISVLRTNDAPGTPRHVLGPGKFSETAFQALDLTLQIANDQGIRLIIPLVDQWSWQGGRADYAAFRGKPRDAFWSDPQLIDDFQKTIRYVLTRTNTLTGTRYCEDRAILAWETGNEILAPSTWTRDIARFIKSVDTNHLVMDGRAGPRLQTEGFSIEDIDIVTTHHYPNLRTTNSFAQLIRANAALAKGKKPYIVGEFGFVSTQQMEDAIQAIAETGIAGGLLWSLRFHNRDGGFYWHSEPAGGNLYKGYHWPGFPAGALYDEANLLSTVRNAAFAIQGLPAPRLPAPDPPTLLPIADPAAISWQGSVGASSYSLERAPKASGPWSVAADNIDECAVQYRPVFSDESAPPGNWYYRVRASNASGTSEPSNLFGPVPVHNSTLVDELADFSKIHSRQGSLEIKTRDCRKAKEDAHRAAGSSGDALIYRAPSDIESFRIYTFFPSAVSDPVCSVSVDDKDYRQMKPARDSYFTGPGDYNYWIPVLYHSTNSIPGAKYLKIELTGDTQIGRVEITHALPME